ncbi:MAG: hypothetical protein HS111_28765 [Kofleriaceae bacterium]|nr:hypothetical protein [Kofleriaceae bacterium]
MIEIGFTADLAEPGAPVRIVGVSLFGVAQGTADRIQQMDLVTAGVPIRAVARRLTQRRPDDRRPSIAVARNEIGEIEVAVGRPGQLPATNLEARFLAAKRAPSASATPATRTSGPARALVERQSSQDSGASWRR